MNHLLRPLRFLSVAPSRRIVLAALVALVAAAAVTGCASFRMSTPQGFAQLPNQRPAYDYRATSAYGVAVSVRALPNREHASLDFWAEAIDRHLQRTGQYAPRGTAPVRTASGLHGRRLQYAYAPAGNAGSTYWATVFVTDARVYVVEAGGNDAAFERARPSVERSLQSFAAP